MSQAATLPRLLSADDVADLLGLSRAQVYLLKHAIGYVQFGRVIRFDPARVQAYIDGNRHGAPEAIRRINVKAL